MESQRGFPKGADLADVYLDQVLCSKSDTRILLSPKKEGISEQMIKSNETKVTIITNLEIKVNNLASKNVSLWTLIDEFGLTDDEGNELRKIS